MNEDILIEKFELMNTRAKIRYFNGFERSRQPSILLDVSKDKKGEFFVIALRTPNELKNIEVLDVKPKEKHLLLLHRNKEEKRKDKFLMGHDERHLFTAAVPNSSVSSVDSAKRALIPPELKDILAKGNLKFKEELKRKNIAFRRSGEWFFISEPNFNPDLLLILKNEPLQRNSVSKPHYLEFAYREGGEDRYFPTFMSKKINVEQRRNGLTEVEYKKLSDDVRKSSNWQVRRVNPQLYAKGRITHADHSTVILKGWHRVYMNGEYLAPASKNILFID